jgi:hypothetical protein
VPVVPSLEVEKYLDFKDMTAYLRDVGKAAPHLVRVFSIGKSREGRPLLVAEVTNRNLKKGREKPGLWIDGGHQGWNLLGSMACLELLRFLVSGHGRDEFLTDLVDHNVFYIAPRLAPDEMDACLATGAITPQTPERAGPLVPSQPRQFRVESPLGSWTPFKRDARLLVRRQPEDRKGPFYDLYRHLDSARLEAMMARDFPSKHAQAGESPLQLASTRAVFEFLRSYQNIFGVVSTSGPGDQLRMLVGPQQEHSYRGLGQRLGELTGLPLTSVVPGSESGGQFLSWAVESLGVFSIDCQMWSLRTAAGLKESVPGTDPLVVEETEMMQILRFVEKDFPANSFMDWTETDEPDLGSGERGGWDWSRTWLNPPAGPYLGRELKRFSRLALGLASAGPRLVIAEVSEKMLGWSGGTGGANEPLRHLTVRVENRGFLPTCPLGRQQSEGGILSTQCVKGEAELLIGSSQSPVEDLQGTGFSQLPDGLPYPAAPALRAGRRFVERDFLFRGNADIEITISHTMAGTDKVVSRPTQIMKPPAFGQPAAVEAPAVPHSPPTDAFEEVFPSFEDLYNEPEPSPEPPPPPPSPPKPVAAPVREPQHARSASFEGISLAPDDEFGIPMPPMPDDPPVSRKVEFPSLGTGPAVPAPQGPFPQAKPGKGRVFGTPPQKPGGLPSANAPRAEEDPLAEGDFSPIPLVKSQQTGSAFEPLAPKSANPPQPPVADYFDQPETFNPRSGAGAETLGVRPPAPRPAPPPGGDEQQPSAPPARLSRISAPQLLRRQRGGQGPADPFNR